eukprot:2111611-Amphidinium_carterae.1
MQWLKYSTNAHFSFFFDHKHHARGLKIASSNSKADHAQDTCIRTPIHTTSKKISGACPEYHTVPLLALLSLRPQSYTVSSRSRATCRERSP